MRFDLRIAGITLLAALAVGCQEAPVTELATQNEDAAVAALTVVGDFSPTIMSSAGGVREIFFTDGGTDRAGGGPGLIRRVLSDGTGLTTLVLNAGRRPRGIALDPVNNQVYWNDFGEGGPGTTQRANVDGSGVTTIVNHGQSGINDIALDVKAKHIYMALSVSFAPFHGVRRVNFDGTGLVDLISTWPPSGPAPAGTFQGWFIDGLAVDPADGHLYYGDIGVLTGNGSPSGIVRTNLDGTGSTSLAPHMDGRGRGIAIDKQNGKIYFGEHNPASSGNGRIWRANLDGTGLSIVVAGLQRPRDVEVDPSGGKIYWVDESTLSIQRANLDGTGVETVVAGLTGPSSLSLRLNEAPVCTTAAASIAIIWPPNHQFVPVEVLGVTDPDGDPVSIVIDAIFQDEPLDTVGDGAFSPDATGVGTSTAQVRAERSGSKKVPGDGRVYHIFFTASDGQGGTCSSVVRVGVPHDVKDNPVDGGPLYKSTN